MIATNALELGIDIGDLDLTLHVGVPPTVASVWQQAGRAGRRGRASAAILIAMDAPLEQYFCRNPDDFFSRTIEARLPDTSNQLLLKGHLLCAAAELAPLSAADANRPDGLLAVAPSSRWGSQPGFGGVAGHVAGPPGPRGLLPGLRGG